MGHKWANGDGWLIPLSSLGGISRGNRIVIHSCGSFWKRCVFCNNEVGCRPEQKVKSAKSSKKGMRHILSGGTVVTDYFRHMYSFYSLTRDLYLPSLSVSLSFICFATETGRTLLGVHIEIAKNASKILYLPQPFKRERALQKLSFKDQAYSSVLGYAVKPFHGDAPK